MIVLGLCAALISSCTEAPTQIVVVVDPDEVVGSQLAAVQVTTRREGTLTERGAGVYDAGAYDLRRDPGRDGHLILRPSSVDDARRLYVTVTGSLRDGSTVHYVVLTRFQRARTLYLVAPLFAACARVTCPDPRTQTCEGGRCAPVTERSLPEELPPRTARDASLDGWFDDLSGSGDSPETRSDAAEADRDLADQTEVSSDNPNADIADASGEDRGVSLDVTDVPQPAEDAPDAATKDVAQSLDVIEEMADADTRRDSVVEIDSADVVGVNLDGGMDAPPLVDWSPSDADDEAGRDATRVDRPGEMDVPAPGRCTPGTLLSGSRPAPLSPWSASYVATTTPRLRWRMSSGTPSFPVCIEVCRDRACTSVEQVIEVPASDAGRVSSVVVPRPLSEGVHFWRLTAQDTVFRPIQWSPFSPTWEFFVVHNAMARSPERSPMWGVVPDFNGDGLADGIAPASNPNSAVQYWSSVRGSGLRDVMPVRINVVNGGVLSVGDVNGDGFVDLVSDYAYLAGGPTGLATTLSGPRAPGSTGGLNCGSAPCNCRVMGDINDNGAADIFCTGLTSPTRETGLRFIYGDDIYGVAGGGDIAIDRFASGAIPGIIGGLFDANSDGICDLAFYRDTRVNVLLGYTDFSRFTTTVSNSFPATPMDRLSAAGDFNGDGNLDLLGATYRAGAQVLLGPLTASTSRAVILPNTGFPDQLASPTETVTDVDRDGLSDVIQGNPLYGSRVSGGGRVRIFLGRPDPMGGAPAFFDVAPTEPLTISRSTVNFGLGWTVIPLGDTDGDGFGDFLAGSGMDSPWPTREIFYYRGVSDVEGSLALPVSFPWNFR